MKTCLMLIDCQAEFLERPGLIPPASQLCYHLRGWLKYFREAGKPVWHVWTTLQAHHRPMPHWRHPRCLEGSASHRVREELRPLEGERVIHKTCFSPFVENDLAKWLNDEGIDSLVLCGLHLHACLRATAQDAYQRGIKTSIAADGWASDEPLLAAATWRYLLSRGIEAAKHPDDGYHRCPTSGKKLFAYPRSSALPLELRPRQLPREWLDRLLASLPDYQDQLAALLVSDIGKPIAAARGELRFAEGLLRAALELRRPRGKQPLGRCAIVTPFNNPVAIPLGKLVPALALGNAVAWKPAPQATRISRLLLKILRASGVGAGQLKLVEGGSDTARALAGAPDIDAVSISGGVAAGWSLAELSLKSWKPLQAELGGNNACVWWNGRRPAAIAADTVESAFGFAGQRCTATRRVIVPRKQLERRLRLLVAATERLNWGLPELVETRVGPLVTATAAELARALLVEATHQGATVLRPLGKGQDNFVGPALIVGADPASEMVRQEAFAPILFVLTADRFSEAMQLAEGVPQGLVASLYSSSQRQWQTFCQRVRCGVLKWNQPTASVAAEHPFGGWKASGFGPPEHGPGDLEFWSRWQARYEPPAS